MTATLHAPERARVVFVREPSQMHAILEPAIAMTIVQRRMEPALLDYIARAAVPASRPSCTYVGLPGAGFRSMLHGVLPGGKGQHLLIDDIDLLAAAFTLLFGFDTLQIRLDPPAPPSLAGRFRLEQAAIRLSCVYGADGIVWDNDPWPGPPSAAGAAHRRSRPHRVAPQAVALFKGACWRSDDAPRVRVHEPAPVSGRFALHLSITPPANQPPGKS